MASPWSLLRSGILNIKMKWIFFGVLLLTLQGGLFSQSVTSDLKDYQMFSKLRNDLLARRPQNELSSPSDNEGIDAWLVPFQGAFTNPFVLKSWQLELARYYVSQKKWAEAREVVAHIMSFQKDPVIYPNALKVLIDIELHLKNKTKVLQIYGDLLSQFQDIDPDGLIWKKIQGHFGNKLSVMDCFDDSATYFGYIQNLAKGRQYQAVFEHSRRFLSRYPRSRYEGDLSFWVGNSYFDMHFYMPAIAALERTEFLSTDPNLSAKAYYLTGKSWLYLQSPQKAYPQFLQVVKLYRNSDYAPFCLYELCKLLRTYGPNKDYQYYSKLFSQRYSTHEAYRAMVWEEKWDSIELASNQESPKQLYDQFKSEMVIEPELSEKFLHFYKAIFGANLDKLGDYIKQFPLSYYAYNVLLHSVSDSNTNTEAQSLADRFMAVSQDGLEKMALEGLQYEQYLKRNGWPSRESDIYYLYAQLMFVLKKGSPESVIRTLQAKLDPVALTYGAIPRVFIKLYYPKVYWPIIVKQAAHYHLDPYLLLAIMREESFFNPYAVSKMKALGLMQIRSTTAREVAFRAGLYWKGDDMLFNPETNVQIAAYYLSWLKKQFSGSTVYTIAAYNAGPDSVLKWKVPGKTPNFDAFVSKVTYPETREYLRKVMNSYVIYKILYSE